MGEMKGPTALALDALERLAGPVSGRRVADLGCGHGRFAAALTERGATVMGVDPQANAVEAARAAAPGADLRVAGAEALPFPDDAAEVAVFLNALHHVPVPLMAAALREALRIAPVVAVIEPLAEGPGHLAMAPLRDETVERAAALAEVAARVDEGAARETGRFTYVATRRVASLDAMIEAAEKVEPGRGERARALRDDLAWSFAAHARPEGDGFTLDQPMIAIGLARREARGEAGKEARKEARREG